MNDQQTPASARADEETRLRVLIAGELPPAAASAIATLDPRLDVTELTAAERAIYASKTRLNVPKPDALHRSIREQLRTTDVLITFPQTPIDLSDHLPRLRWLQLLTAGVDELPDQKLLQRVPVTTIREVRARPVAEYALMLVLAFAKSLPGSLVLKRERGWNRLGAMELRGRTLGIVGLGAIGTETARLAKAFGMRIIALRRTTIGEIPEYVDTLLPSERLPELLQQSDFVVLTAPATQATRGMIGAAELRAMPPHAVLINVARGSLVDEQALIRALQKGWIAGAGLDVFEEEPLDPRSPLYEMDNVLISCHSAGQTDQFAERVLPILLENLRHFLANAPLRNRVDPSRGY